MFRFERKNIVSIFLTPKLFKETAVVQVKINHLTVHLLKIRC